ncbi:MAG: hypothetical protein AB9883_07610 [Acidaminococcaceae bacterium]
MKFYEVSIYDGDYFELIGADDEVEAKKFLVKNLGYNYLNLEEEVKIRQLSNEAEIKIQFDEGVVEKTVEEWLKFANYEDINPYYFGGSDL